MAEELLLEPVTYMPSHHGGALAGELVVGKRGKEALRAGWGVLIGNLIVIGLKLAYSGVILFFYIKAMV